MAPNALTRAVALGVFESFNCPGGQRRDPVDSGPGKQPPCFNAPPSLYSGKVFNRIQKGRAPKVDAPQGNEGRRPADPNR